MNDRPQTLAPQHMRVVEAFKGLVRAVWLDEKADEEGRRGNRYSFELPDMTPELETLLTDAAMQVRETSDPDFAWNFFPEGKLDEWPRVKLWQALDNDMVRMPEVEDRPLVDVVRTCWEVYGDIDEVVAITSSPDFVRKGERAHASLVLRVPMGVPPMDLLRVIDDRRRAHIDADWELQGAPELNFPPTSQDRPDEEAWLELKGEIMRIVEPYRMVEAAWFHDEGGARPHVYVYGENDARLDASLRAAKVVPLYVMKLSEVPKEAGCLFNPLTRLLKAEAENDHEAASRIRAKIRGAAAKNQPRNLRSDPSSHYVQCRWCRHEIPASTNPNYEERCPECRAVQSATTIPTKSKAMPLISIFVNPDGTSYVECVFAPDVPGRWDLAPVRRYTVPKEWAQEFATHPMGKREP